MQIAHPHGMRVTSYEALMIQEKTIFIKATTGKAGQNGDENPA
ncbi:hypothetical protein AB7W88_13230 [Providencia vermicola]